MFEKVLKRLCPCYYGRPEGDQSEYPSFQNKSSNYNHTTSSSEDSSNSRSTNDTISCGATEETWKGTLNTVQPQPMYAFPIDSKKGVIRNQKAFLKPPLYWKKTMKDLQLEGPLVFQKLKQKNSSHGNGKSEKKKKFNPPFLKHSKTMADINSLPSVTTVDIRWLKSQSLSNLTSKKKGCEKNEYLIGNQSDTMTALLGMKYGDCKKDCSCLKNQVFPDISHGVILFTAAYFNKKKLFMININRLENLPRKGRDGNYYYTVVKLAVLPSEKYIRCTKILNNCKNPEVKQDFTFSVKELSGKVLRLSVFDASLQKQHGAVGHALLNLEDIVFDQPKKYRVKLYRRTQPHICPGNLSVSLKYCNEEDKFTIIVEKGRNLSLQKDKNVKLNTYVKVTFYTFGEKVKTKKSIVAFNCRDPKYNSTFTFKIRNDQIDNVSVTVAVRLKAFVNDITIGKLNFGPFFYFDNDKLTPWGRVFLKKETVSHWYRMYL